MATFAFDMAKMVRILCALALFCVGLAHKPPVAEAAIPLSEIAAYVLPDGTIPVLCLADHGETEKHDSKNYTNGCEACRISASIIVPAPSDTLGQPIARSIEMLLPVRYEAFYRQLFPPNASPRGPPSGLSA